MTQDHVDPTLDDLEQAKAESARWEAAWDNDSGNNPNKYHSQRQQARERVRLLTLQLKALGDLPITDAERVALELDRLHPAARHGDTIEHSGRRYIRRCTPAQKSRSGNVISWDCTWVAD